MIDAYNGTVELYVYDEEDPIIRVWRKIFPDLFRDKAEMPADLQAHVRYPANMLLIQGLAYAKYHMTDPAVFYNQEDLWIRATEKYYQSVQPVEPYYVIWDLPDTDEPEFVLMMPFTPKNRQVMIGWIAGMCDPGQYGRVLAYKFPKEKRVLGPQQAETKIDQDRFLSGQLTLWDQRGSNVIRGNVLAIPIGETLLYVEPIYLQAETAAYPELRLVAVMHGDTLSYGQSFDEAFENYLRHLGEKRFQEASRSLEALQTALEGLSEQAGHERADEGLRGQDAEDLHPLRCGLVSGGRREGRGRLPGRQRALQERPDLPGPLGHRELQGGDGAVAWPRRPSCRESVRFRGTAPVRRRACRSPCASRRVSRDGASCRPGENGTHRNTAP